MVVNQLKRLLGKIIRFGMTLPDIRKHHTYSHRVVLQLSVPHTASPTFIRLIGSIATVGMLATSTLCLPVGNTNKLKLLAYHGRYVCSYAETKVFQWCISWSHYDPAEYRERRALRAVYSTSWCTPPNVHQELVPVRTNLDNSG